MKLSPNFTLEEMTSSQYGARFNIDNTPPDLIIANLLKLCTEYLEPLRKAIGGPIVISSGFRSPKINAAIGGSKSSAHMFGLAVDIIVPGKPVKDVCRIASLMRPKYDQIIDEFDSWAHLAIAAPGKTPRGQLLEARNGPAGVMYKTAVFV